MCDAVHGQTDVSVQTTPEEPHTIRARQRRYIFSAVCLCLIIVNISFSLPAPMLPKVALDKGVSSGMLGVIFSMHAITVFLLAPVIGHTLQHRYATRRAMMASGVWLGSVASALFGLVDRIESPTMFAAACMALRVSLGTCCAMVDTSSGAIVMAVYSRTPYFAAAMGLLEASLAVGFVFGPSIGGVLSSWLGFGGPFFIAAALSGPAAFLPLTLPFDVEQQDRTADGAGGASSALEGQDSSGSAAQSSGTSGARPDGKAREPVSVGLVLRNPVAIVIVACAATSSASMTFLEPTLSPHMIARGFTMAMVGFAFTLIAIIYCGASPLVGLVAGRVGKLPTMMTGLPVMVLGFLVMGPSPLLDILLPKHMSESMIASLMYLSMFLLGLGGSIAFVPTMPAMLDAVTKQLGYSPEGLPDLLSGLLNGVYYGGGSIGPVLGGASVQVLSFAWASTLSGLLLLLLFVAVMLVLLANHQYDRTPPPETEATEPLLSREARAGEGGPQAAPSAAGGGEMADAAV